VFNHENERRKKINNNNNNKLLDETDVVIEDFKLVSYHLGPFHQHNTLSEEIKNKIETETRSRLQDRFLDKAIKEQRKAKSTGGRALSVVDFDASPENPALFFITILSSSLADNNFFHCEFESNSNNMTSSRDLNMTVKFVSNLPCPTMNKNINNEGTDL
jgi:hypothetical protein